MNSPIPKFGDVRIRRACSGVGTEGLCTSVLSFTVPGEFVAPRAAKVELFGVGSLPTFYVAKRMPSNGVTNITCYDRMAFANSQFPAESIDENVNDVPISTVTALISRACEVGDIIGIPSWLQYLPRSMLDCKCSEILSVIAKTAVGVWMVSSDNKYVFRAYGSEGMSITIRKHTALELGDTYKIAGIQARKGSGTVYRRGSQFYAYNGLFIESDIITDEGLTEVWGRANSAERQAFSCGTAIVPYIPEVTALVKFQQYSEEPNKKVFVITEIDCHISAGGIIASLACSYTSGDEIETRGYISLAIDECVKYGRSKNIIYTAYQGIIIVDDEEV